MIGLIDYNMGNLRSVAKALEFLGATPKLVSSAEELRQCDSLLLPGVGNFGDGMRELEKRNLSNTIREMVKEGHPFLGICLGMQMLFDSSEEAPGVTGLGIVPGTVRHFPEVGEKIPQIGWNQVKMIKAMPANQHWPEDGFAYFVHSYYCVPTDPSMVAGVTDYIVNFAACVGFDNVFACQFHPEKSQKNGLELLKSFVEQDKAYVARQS